GGRALYQTYEAVYYDQDGRRVGLRNDTWIRIERSKPREKKKYGEIALAQWTPADIARFQEAYRRQTRATERYWDDVTVRDALGRRPGAADAHRGPLPQVQLHGRRHLGEGPGQRQVRARRQGLRALRAPVREPPRRGDGHRDRRGRAAASMTRVREIARRVSNWGRWGADDERGTVNFITPDVVCRAAACVRRGTVFSLGLPFGADGPQ